MLLRTIATYEFFMDLDGLEGSVQVDLVESDVPSECDCCGTDTGRVFWEAEQTGVVWCMTCAFAQINSTISHVVEA